MGGDEELRRLIVIEEEKLREIISKYLFTHLTTEDGITPEQFMSQFASTTHTGLIIKGDEDKISEVFKEVKETARNSGAGRDTNLIREDYRVVREMGYKNKQEFTEEFDFLFPIDEKTSKILDILYGKVPVPNERSNNRIEIYAKRRVSGGELSDLWDVGLRGRRLCDEEHYKDKLKSGDYSLCPCPENFKKFCKGVGEVLKKYAVKDSI